MVMDHAQHTYLYQKTQLWDTMCGILVYRYPRVKDIQAKGTEVFQNAGSTDCRVFAVVWRDSKLAIALLATP